MADRKSGPVKPPTIDLTARAATPGGAAGTRPANKGPARPRAAAATPAGPAPGAAESGAEGAVAGAEFITEPPRPTEPPRSPPHGAPAPPPPRPPARLAMPWSAISIAAVGGALLGTGVTYLLASWIPLPASAPAFPDPSPVLAEQSTRLDGLEQRFAATEATAGETRLGLDAAVTRLETDLAGMRGTLAELAAAIPQPLTVDLPGLEDRLRTRESRVDAIGAGASPADAGALAENLVAIEAGLADLTGRLAGHDRKLAASDAAMTRFAADLEAAQVAIASRNLSLDGAALAPAIRLPLVVAGRETAVAAGRPFAAELAGLKAIFPDLAVPPAIAAAAASGLPRPDILAGRFSLAVPDIPAGRTRTPTGDWAGDALEWAKALLALRPAGEVEGDTPEAVVSRLEGAVRRRDFAAAAQLMQQLPEPMRLAAGSLVEDIAALAAAEDFIAALRAQALAPAAGAAP